MDVIERLVVAQGPVRRAMVEKPPHLRPGEIFGRAQEPRHREGAAGGVGTATLQVAKGLGARTIAAVSTEEKAAFARAAGADEAVVGPDFKGAVKELTGGRGVDVVLDVVGGDAFTDSLH